MSGRAADRVLGVLLGLAALLALPGVALWRGVERAGIEWLVVPAVLATLSFAFYAFDKFRATRGQGRLPEVQLLTIDALGGWPGGFAAQQLLRHKNAKAGYQALFWLIVASHEFAAAWWLFG